MAKYSDKKNTCFGENAASFATSMFSCANFEIANLKSTAVNAVLFLIVRAILSIRITILVLSGILLNNKNKIAFANSLAF